MIGKPRCNLLGEAPGSHEGRAVMDRDQSEMIAADLPIQSLQGGHLETARTAPHGPDVDEKIASAVVA